MPFDYNCTALVQMVEKYPCIWNRGDLDYRNKAAKDRSWSEICQSLDTNFNSFSPTKQSEIENTLRDKWSNIRDTMVRYLRQRCSKPTKRYHYADACHFLEKMYTRPFDPDITPEMKMSGEDMVEFDPSMQNVMCVLGEEEESTVEEFDNRVKTEPPDVSELERCNERHLQGSTSEEESRPPPMKKTKITPKSHSDMSHHTDICVTKESQLDEDEAFFISVLPHVRSLSQDEKLDFRMGVLQMIKDAKKRAATA